MKYTAVLLAALGLAGAIAVAQERRSGPDPFAPAPARPAGKLVIVDPLDFRKPIPDPEEGIIPKYDEKAVSFSGLLVNRGRDTKPQRYWYEFQAEIPQPVPPASAGPRKKPVKLGPDNAKETLTVRFYMDQEDARLRASSVGQVEVTVEGRGQIVLGVLSLVINDARVVAVRPAPKPAAPLKR